MEKVTDLIGLKPSTGPSAAEEAVQRSQMLRVGRETIAANAAAASAGTGASLKGALSYDDKKKKQTLGG